MDLATKLFGSTSYTNFKGQKPKKEETPGFIHKLANKLFPKPLISPISVNRPRPTNMPSPMASPQPEQPFYFNFDKYKNTTGFKPQQPPKPIADIIRKHFPNEATTAALLASTENALYNPKADGINTDQSIDRGIFQINSNTFNGLRARRTREMDAIGANSYDQMYDPELNTQVARMVYDEGGLGRWFAWQDKGYDLMDGYFTHPKLKAKKR